MDIPEPVGNNPAVSESKPGGLPSSIHTEEEAINPSAHAMHSEPTVDTRFEVAISPRARSEPSQRLGSSTAETSTDQIIRMVEELSRIQPLHEIVLGEIKETLTTVLGHVDQQGKTMVGLMGEVKKQGEVMGELVREVAKQGARQDKQGEVMGELVREVAKQGEVMEDLIREVAKQGARQDKQGDMMVELMREFARQSIETGERLDKQGVRLDKQGERLDSQGERLDSMMAQLLVQGRALNRLLAPQEDSTAEPRRQEERKD